MRQPKMRNMIDQFESRRLMAFTPAAVVVDPPITIISPTPIVIGTREIHDLSFTAANGRTYLMTVSNATASITMTGQDLPTIYHHHAIFHPGEIENPYLIAITDAAAGKAVLNINRASAGRGAFNVGTITGGNIAAINAQDVVPTSAVTLASVHKMTLAGNDGAVISLGSYPTSLKFSGNFTGSIAAAGLTSLSAYSITGSTIATTGAFIAGKNQIGSINVVHQIGQTSILSTGNIGSITAAYIQQSIITAGTTATSVVPESVSVFYLGATIKSVRVSTKRTDGFEEGFVSNTIISAFNLGALQLGALAADGGGVAAHNIASISAISPAGGLDRIKIHLVQEQMRTASKLQSSLDHLNIPFQTGVNGFQNTVIYNFSVNVLR